MPDTAIKLMKPHKPWRGKRVVIKWPGWQFGIEIKIYAKTRNPKEGEDDRYEVITGYEVSWSSLGGTNLELTARYIGAMAVALAEAKAMEKKYVGCSFR